MQHGSNLIHLNSYANFVCFLFCQAKASNGGSYKNRRTGALGAAKRRRTLSSSNHWCRAQLSCQRLITTKNGSQFTQNNSSMKVFGPHNEWAGKHDADQNINSFTITHYKKSISYLHTSNRFLFRLSLESLESQQKVTNLLQDAFQLSYTPSPISLLVLLFSNTGPITIFRMVS